MTSDPPEEIRLKDHGRMLEEVSALARKKNITVTKDLDSKGRDKVDKLAKLQGAEFERAFSKAMIEGHEKAIEKFEKQIADGKDADVRAWAEKRIVTLREHLEMARTTLTASR